MHRKALLFIMTVAGVAMAGAARAEVPFFNAVCPGNIEVHADDGGPVYVNGKETRLKRFNGDYYEARLGSLTISVTIRPDGTPDISYTGKGGANGVCRIKAAGSGSDRQPDVGMARPSRRDRSAEMDMRMMPAFCRGEAADQFDRRPSEITTNMAFRAGKRIVVQGNFPEGKRTTFFNCWFDGDGNFISVN
jgi:hypothetical protein